MRSSLDKRRRKDPSFWKAINRVLLVFVALGVAVIVIFWFYPELARRNEMSRKLDQDKQALTAEQHLSKQREREVFLLQNDRGYIETIARDKLDMMKEGETIFRFDQTKAATPPAKTN